MIVIVLGPDRLRARTAVNKLVADHDPGGQNTFRFDADTDPLSAVLNGVATPSFFGDTRVIVATGYLTRAKQVAGTPAAGSRSSRSARSKSNLGDLESVIATAENQAVLILHEPDLATLPAAMKPLLPDSTAITEHQPQRGQALIDLTVASFQNWNVSIDRDVARHLLDRLFPSAWQQAASNPAFDQPPDIESLINEIEKLSLAASSDGITEDLIDQLTPQAATERTFPLLDAIVAGRRTEAIRELGSTPHADDERSRILAQAMQQVEYAAGAAQPGRPSDPLRAGRELGMSNPNRMKPVLRSVAESRISVSKLLDATLEADRRIKRGRDPEPVDALYNMILGTVEDGGG